MGMEFPRKCHWFLLTCHQIVISIYTYIFSLWLIGFYNPKPLLYIKEVRNRHTRYKKSFKCQNLIYPSHKSKLCKKTTRAKLEFRDWGESSNTYKMKTNLRGSLTIFSPLQWLFTYLFWILLQEEELSILFMRFVFTTVSLRVILRYPLMLLVLDIGLCYTPLVIWLETLSLIYLARQCFGSCFSQEGEIIFSFASLDGVCSSL